jgi:RHS repeat-associated protein
MFYDEAGRLTLMKTGSYPFNAFTTLVNDISYTSSGALQSEKYGNGLIHSMDYNNRLQLTDIRLGMPDDPESVFRISYIFGTANNVNGQDSEITPANNDGNIARIKYFISGTLQYSQTFQYDAVNRLRHAVEHSNGVYEDGARAWYQTFDYDQFGNRGINPEYTSDNADAENTALKLADFSAANNRITANGFAYDASGNLIAEPGNSYAYDAENRIVTATTAGGVTSRYSYDGLGRRMKKIVGVVGTRFEYGASGELIVEWNDVDTNKIALKDYFYKGGGVIATTKAGGGYDYATADHLGSPRAWTGSDGAVVTGGRHDYTPFGGELLAGYGTRTADQGYAASAQQDGQRNQFGSHERDETGLDFMQARYYSSMQGRFTSADPIIVTATRMLDPQQFNLYSYVRNNPLAYTDPTGMDPQYVETEKERDKKREQKKAQKKKENKGEPPAPNPKIVNQKVNELSDLTPEMREDLREVYVAEYQDQYQTLQEGNTRTNYGTTVPQTTETTNSTGQTNTSTAGVEVGVSGNTPSAKINLGETNVGDTKGSVKVNSNNRQSAGAARNEALENMKAGFVERYLGTTITINRTTTMPGGPLTLDHRSLGVYLQYVRITARNHAANTFSVVRKRR